MNQIKVNGITYDIIQRHTAEQMRADGLNALADLMDTNAQDANLVLKRPNGKTQYFAISHTSGYVSDPISLGAF